MLINTPWTIAWGAVAILSEGDRIRDEVKGPAGEGRYDTLTPMRAPFTVRSGRGLVTQTMSFHRVVQFPTAAAAKIYSLTHDADLSSLASTVGLAPNATMAAISGGTWVLGNAAVKWDMTTVADCFECHYTITFGALVQTVAPPDPSAPGTPAIGTPASEVIDFGGGNGLAGS